MDILYAKSKKLESTIQELERDKNDTKALLITKDLELAELRAKNTILQKMINRQEIYWKTLQLQKKIDQLEKALSNSETEYKEHIERKEDRIESLQKELNSMHDLKHRLYESQENYNSLQVRTNELSTQILELEDHVERKEKEINDLNLHIDSMTNITTELTEQLEYHKENAKEISLLNKELHHQIHRHEKGMALLEARITIKEEEIDALLNTIDEQSTILNDKSIIIEKLEEKFKIYREWIERTVVPHLRQHKKAVEPNSLISELHKTKKFLNRQAIHINDLKSDIHWLTVQNRQLLVFISDICMDHVEQWDLNLKFSTTMKKETKKYN
ncbi:uncharacterized protein BX663DRAFT_520837 [Cokeromyces recurvatus]|uniref:uncharacterized protein n=1 Tax=Cokeromyces recurvatus TaxID=90255 RepID=UPI00221FD7F4|nr:uncharacterized protein BX663DRAFT_520837 [Cokeromyces recurvatus]KAI7899647.1 hypothetical protein BX663DRAFT_520837 [Cokeromyces recurvatus]